MIVFQEWAMYLINDRILIWCRVSMKEYHRQLVSAAGQIVVMFGIFLWMLLSLQLTHMDVSFINKNCSTSVPKTSRSMTLFKNIFATSQKNWRTFIISIHICILHKICSEYNIDQSFYVSDTGVVRSLIYDYDVIHLFLYLPTTM